MTAKWIDHSERNDTCSRCHSPTQVGQRIYWLRRGTILCELCGSMAEHEEPEVGAVESGVQSDLDKLPPEAAESAVAQIALNNARRIDNGDVADRDIASLYKELRQAITQLRLDFPPKPEEDDTEKSRRRRERMLMMDDYDKLRARHAALAGQFPGDLGLRPDAAQRRAAQPLYPAEAGRGLGPGTRGEVPLPRSG